MFGRTLCVKFAEREAGRAMWCHAQRELEWEWYPSITTPDEIMNYHANLCQLSPREKKHLFRLVPPENCGKGILVHISPGEMYEVTGEARTGASAALYILSARGKQGCLCVKSSIYNRFDWSSIEVGLASDWPDYPTLSFDNTELTPVGRWTLWMTESRAKWSRLCEALKSVLDYTDADCERAEPLLPGPVAIGRKSDLRTIRDQFKALRISAEVRLDEDIETELDRYHLVYD